MDRLLDFNRVLFGFYFLRNVRSLIQLKLNVTVGSHLPLIFIFQVFNEFVNCFLFSDLGHSWDLSHILGLGSNEFFSVISYNQEGFIVLNWQIGKFLLHFSF